MRRVLVQIGIPVFFYISGVSNTCAHKTQSTKFLPFAWFKFKRLIIPLVVAVFLFLIPRLYMIQDFNSYGRIDDQKVSNYFEYIAKVLPEVPLKISWLWFLPALFIDSLIHYPLLMLVKRRSEKIPLEKWDAMYYCAMLINFAIWAALCTLVMGPEVGKEWMIPIIVVLFVSLVIYTFVPNLLITHSGERSHYVALAVKLMGPLVMAVMNVYKDGDIDGSIYGFLTMINYDLVFMCQGIVDTVYRKEQERAIKELSSTALTFVGFLFFFTTYSLTAPTSGENAGYLFNYPLYRKTYMQTLHTTGTWLWLYVTINEARNKLNQQFSKSHYDTIVGSSLYIYISHYLWLLVGAKISVEWTDMPFGLNLFLLILQGEVLCFLTYFILKAGIERLAALKKGE